MNYWKNIVSTQNSVRSSKKGNLTHKKEMSKSVLFREWSVGQVTCINLRNNGRSAFNLCTKLSNWAIKKGHTFFFLFTIPKLPGWCLNLGLLRIQQQQLLSTLCSLRWIYPWGWDDATYPAVKFTVGVVAVGLHNVSNSYHWARCWKIDIDLLSHRNVVSFPR